MTQMSTDMLLSSRKRLIFAFDTVTVQSSLSNYMLLILCYPFLLRRTLVLAVQLLILAGVYGSYGFEWCRSRPDYALIKWIFQVKYKLNSTDTICGMLGGGIKVIM